MAAMMQHTCSKMFLLVVLCFVVSESHYQHPSHDFVPANFTGELKHAHSTCNKYFCVSVVSYCTLQKKCHCNPKKDCSCCKECAICLGKYYKHCCDCVGMCQKNVTVQIPTMTSTVDFLPDPNNELFRTLTEKPIPQLKYQIVTIPVFEELAHHHMTNRQFKITSVKGAEEEEEEVAAVSKGRVYDGISSKDYWNNIQAGLKETSDFHLEQGLLCTVCYFDKCVALNECKMSCDSMGASSYRWFHNGCCECVGPTCLNYGNVYPKCRECLN